MASARTQPRHPRFWNLAVPLILLLAVAVAFWRSARVPFIFDDKPAIERNPSIRDLGSWRDILRPPKTAAGATGRPLVNLSLALNYASGGDDAAGYHWFNLAIHALAGLTLWGVLRRTWRGVNELARGCEALAAATALLWLVHPLVTESVVCVIQRNEVLVSLFYLLTFYCFIRSTEPVARQRTWAAVAVACCLLGMASKEVMVTAPLSLLLFDRAFFAGSFRAAWTRRWRFYSALAATWILLAVLVTGQAQRAGTVGFDLGTTPWSYLLTQCRALTIYLKLVLWPHPLVLDYGFETVHSLGEIWPQAGLIFALLVAAGVACWRWPRAGFGAAAFFLILAPSSSFVPLTTQTIAEHRMYLPLAVVLALLVAGGYRVLSRAGGLPAVVVALGLGGLTFDRIDDYRSEAAIWTDTLAKAPRNARAYASVGNVFARQRQWSEALPYYEESVRLRPDYADAQNDLANVLTALGRREEALGHYEAALKLKPADDDIEYNLGTALAQAGRWSEAIAHFVVVTQRNPRHAKALNSLGDARLKTGRPEEALAAFDAAVAVEPDLAAAQNNAGIALVTLGRFAEAIPHYEAALRELPHSAQVHHNFALALDGAARRSEAIVQEEAALAIEPDFPEAREHLFQLRAQK